ncbi:unnamed protein product [Moneuplotes crassus]|uniref:Uncharacterized protein n=1 Tax=Euplotes crassus TaxID=5936 RepID=A0AAD2DBJ3_EUPCR|nr:unnamed protein product [Moneuplotes crassus]
MIIKRKPKAGLDQSDEAQGDKKQSYTGLDLDAYCTCGMAVQPHDCEMVTQNILIKGANAGDPPLLCMASYPKGMKIEISVKAEDAEGQQKESLVSEMPIIDIKEEVKEDSKSEESKNEEVKEPSTKRGRGRGRPREFPQTEFYTKNMRLDVLNKALVRAARREFTELFRLFCINSGLFQPEDPEGDLDAVIASDPSEVLKMNFGMSDEQFDEAMQKFVPYALQVESPEDVSDVHGELDNLKQFLTVLVDPDKGSSVLFPGTDKLLKDELRSLCFSYSHSKLDAFMVLPEMRFVLAKVLSPEYIDSFIAKNPTLSENEGIYKQCAELMLQQMSKHNKANKHEEPRDEI